MKHNDRLTVEQVLQQATARFKRIKRISEPHIRRSSSDAWSKCPCQGSHLLADHAALERVAQALVRMYEIPMTDSGFPEAIREVGRALTRAGR